MSNHKECCNLCAGAMLFILVCIGTPVIIVPYSVFGEYNKNECFVGRVEYPTTIPTFNNSNNWASCDCGRRCISWTPCIKLYSNVSKDQYLKKDYFYDSVECTLQNYSCPNGEDIRNIPENISNSKSIYDQYINTTIDCYYDTGITNIFMEREFVLTLILTFAIPICLLISCCLCNNVTCKKNEENNTKNNNIKKNNKNNEMILIKIIK